MAEEYKLKTILKAFKSALDDDADITAAVHVGEDIRNPLGENDAPFIILVPAGYQRGQGVDNFAPNIQVEWGIVDEEIVNNEYRGYYTADDEGEKIYEALKTTGYVLQTVDYDIDALTVFPLFTAGMTVSLDRPNTIGVN